MHRPLFLDELEELSEEEQAFYFTYTIKTEIVKDESAWAHRMDHYMKMGSDQIHVTAILISLGIISGLAYLLYAWLDRGLKSD